ncbi:MAG: hypothetical protein M3Q39_16035 [Actinomycetota bacterium]|nr:hypothetical protein [Actinomycetota bacterium]
MADELLEPAVESTGLLTVWQTQSFRLRYMELPSVVSDGVVQDRFILVADKVSNMNATPLLSFFAKGIGAAGALVTPAEVEL